MEYKEKVIALLNSQELSKEQKEMLETIFPELAESDDEKVRKAIIELVKQNSDILNPLNQSNMLAWLEKHGEQNLANSAKTCKDEQKPAEYNRETSTDLRDIVDNEANAIWEEESTDGCHLVIDSFNMFYGICMQIAEAVVDYKKPAWSEEDEEHLERILKELENQRQRLINSPYLDKIESDYNWLKSLRPQSTWKPSEEQFNNTSCTHLSKEEAESKVWKQ